MSALAMSVALPTPLSTLDRDEVLAFLRDVVRGRWQLAARSWDLEGRSFTFERRRELGAMPRRELELLALVSRGASNFEAGCILELRDPTICGYVSQLARRLDARPIDIVAFGPLLQRLEEP